MSYSGRKCQENVEREDGSTLATGRPWPMTARLPTCNLGLSPPVGSRKASPDHRDKHETKGGQSVAMVVWWRSGEGEMEAGRRRVTMTMMMS